MDGALKMLEDPMAFGAMMVHLGDADGMVAGITRHYPETLRIALRIIAKRSGVRKVSGLFIMIWQRKIYLLADTTVNIDPSPKDLAENCAPKCPAGKAAGYRTPGCIAVVLQLRLGTVQGFQQGPAGG